MFLFAPSVRCSQPSAGTNVSLLTSMAVLKSTRYGYFTSALAFVHPVSSANRETNKKLIFFIS